MLFNCTFDSIQLNIPSTVNRQRKAFFGFTRKTWKTKRLPLSLIVANLFISNIYAVKMIDCQFRFIQPKFLVT